MAELNQKKLAKNTVFFGLEDVLAPGPVNRKVDKKKIKELLGQLSQMEPGLDFNLVLLSSQTKKIALKKAKKFGLDKFFRKGNILFVTKEYIDSKDKVDRARHERQLKLDPGFKDEYFKQLAIRKFLEDNSVPRERAVFVGHDLLTDGFYSMRYSKVDVAFVKKSFSERHQPRKPVIPGLIYVRLDWKDIKKLLAGKFGRPDYSLLEKYVFDSMKRALLGGTELGALARLAEGNN